MLRRIKRRYLALQLDSRKMPNRKELMDAVWRSILKLYGEYGASRTDLQLIIYDEENKTAVIRASLETVNLVRSSLASIISVAGREAAVHVLAVSGTIKALRIKSKTYSH